MRQIVLAFVCVLVAMPVVGQPARPGKAAIASGHPLATEAGFQVLRRGGNAFDAAVAVSAALTVVEPYGSGPGGGGFYLLHRAEDSMQVMVDGREKAPGRATRDMYLGDDGEPVRALSREGPLSAGIPGLPAALVHMAQKYGNLPLSESLAPAIRHAREGFAADRRLLMGVSFKRDAMAAGADTARYYLDNGEVPAEGWLVRQPELGDTWEAIARTEGHAFYEGDLAGRLVDAVRADGGIWTRADLAAYEVVERAPVVGSYRGMRIVTTPPPSAGGVLLINILNIIEPFDLTRLDSVTTKHLLAEAMRRAFRDRAEYLGDPDFVSMPLERLMHPYYAAGQRASIRLDRATPSDSLPGVQPADSGPQTTHFSVMDADGNRVGGTQSLNFWFGSGYMVPDTGVMLNNEMNDFSVKPGTPDAFGLVGSGANEIAPHKRMLSSMMPTFLESDKGVAIVGTNGGSRIISALVLSTLVRAGGGDGMDMVSLPRFHHQYLPDEIFYEPKALTDDEKVGLEALGHALRESNRLYGTMQAITWDFDGNEIVAGSDPRGLGSGELLVY